MDRNLHTDEFVRLLREKSDEFRMYPSKRIWYSIYNNIHPGRKWPSVAMTISLIISLLLIGYLNTNNPTLPSSKENSYSQLSQTTYSSMVYQPFAEYIGSENNTTIDWNTSTGKTVASLDQTQDASNNRIPSLASKLPKNQQNDLQDIDAFPYSNDQRIVTNNHLIVGNIKKTNSPGIFKNNHAENVIQETTKTVFDADPITLINSQKISRETILESTGHKSAAASDYKHNLGVAIENSNFQVVKNDFTSNKGNVISAEDKEWIDNYAMYNRPAPKKWAGKLAWQMYVTPSVVYRTLSNDPNLETATSGAPFVVSANNSDINKDVIQKPSVGLELGAGLQYSILKRLRLRTGLQLNYTRYNAHAFHNTHPVSTRLTMLDLESNSTYELYKTTPYSNKTGLEPVKLHNQTFQVSIPLGADFRVLGNENLQWNIGLAIQPTFVVGGKSYLISSDRRNYVKESSMLNRWNLNAGIETFITYKYNGLTWQIGPQFRSQLLSTNKKEFLIQEKLVNYGIKVGVSKNLK